MIKIDLDKYTYIMDNGKQYALRYGEPWRDLCGDKFVYAMACMIQDLEDEVKSLRKELG